MKESTEVFVLRIKKYAGISLIVYGVIIVMLLMIRSRVEAIPDTVVVDNTPKEEALALETIDKWSLQADDNKIHTFRNTEAVNVTIKYGDYNQLVAGNNYTCIKYNEGHYDYLIVHYFNNQGFLDSWNKIVFAVNNDAAQDIAYEERASGYIATITDNIVVITSRDANHDMSYESYVDCFDDKIFVNENY